MDSESVLGVHHLLHLTPRPVRCRIGCAAKTIAVPGCTQYRPPPAAEIFALCFIALPPRRIRLISPPSSATLALKRLVMFQYYALLTTS